ncbi:CapA family protein [Leptothermofonsia sp. ETS-13]|uniref:CapA family protein n=1 Tax=Leptothermofonsia sp. ETS-13 TaxID=3035696 RepID=UPI003BA0EDF4
MVYTDKLYQPPIVELAKAGNFQAIAHWINQFLVPYGMHASVGAIRPGYLKVLVELPWVESEDLPDDRRDYLVRYICHRIWHLNSAVIEGVQIAAQFAGESKILWQQSVRVVSPARRLRQQQSQQLRTQVQQTAQRKTQLKTMRAFLVSGAPLFAFFFGCFLGFSKAPVEQTNAVASSQPETNKSQTGSGEQATVRPDTVQAALEAVPVVKHDKVADPNDPTVTLMFSGDVTLGEAFEETIGKDYDHAFAAMDEYRQADLAMVNLENPLTKATIPLPDKQFNFKADPESVKVLEKGGVDLVTLANNHTMDFEEAGLTETIDTLDRSGILHLGAGRDEKEARRPEIVEVKGQRVAYLGYYGADFHAAGKGKAGTNFADEARIAADIKSIRDQVDWIVVNFHWGEELANYPAEWQIDLAHFTVDQGADLIVGHHPHVLQGAEIYKGRPIAYSLGNFIFGGNSRKDYDTAVLKVALKDRQMKVEFLPVEVRNYQPQVVGGDRGAQILKQIHDLSTSFTQPMRSPTVLDARISPKIEPSTAPTPADKSSSPTGSDTPFIEPKTPEADSSSPESSPPTEATSPSPEATVPPADTSAPGTEPTPSANTATPSPQPTLPSDSSVPPADFSTPKDSSTPSVQPTPSGEAISPSPEPTIPQDMASPAADPVLSTDSVQPQDSDSTASDSQSPNAQPNHLDNTVSPDAQYSESSDPSTDTTPSYSNEAVNPDVPASEDTATSDYSSDYSTDTTDSLTNPAEADRLLREAEKLLQEETPPADTVDPPSAVGGPADPVDSYKDSSTDGVESGTPDASTSEAPVDFSQPPAPQEDASSQTSTPAEVPAAEAISEDSVTESVPESVSEQPIEQPADSSMDTSLIYPEILPTPDGAEVRREEAIALRYLSGLHQSLADDLKYQESDEDASVPEEDTAIAPPVALMAAAIW